MTTSSSTAPRLRRALTGLGIVAASILVLAPVAGAERPRTTTQAAGETSRGGSTHGAGPAEQEAPAPVAPQDSGSGPQSFQTSSRHEQALCHRTGTPSDPYVLITVAFHIVDGQVVSSDGGHERHEGQVFDPASRGVGDGWGDIIPPFTTAEGASYPGQNWPAGQATFENGCEPASAAEAPPGPAVGEDDGDGDGDGSEGGQPGRPAERSDDRTVGEDGRPDGRDRQPDGETKAPVTRDRRRPDRGSGGTPAGAPVAEQQAHRTHAVTGDIAAVLGQQVTRDADGDRVVPASSSEPAIVAGLARTDTSLAILVMLVLSALIGGYAAVDAIRERMRRTG